MTKVLLTGGSGFIAAHILELLLERGHMVITTVRSAEKAQQIREAHADIPPERLAFKIVEDIARPGAFDDAVKVEGLEAVLHTASPFHFKAQDIQTELLDPAVNGTRSILGAIQAHAPSVRRVVITSSFAAIVNPHLPLTSPGHTYSEGDWNPITAGEALQSANWGYRASKTFAERAAWEFVDQAHPNFTLATVNPPLVLGPLVHALGPAGLAALNTSNELVRDLLSGTYRDALPPATVVLWVDVRDLALAHVRAMERDDAAGKRFFVTAGYFNPKIVCEIIRDNFPQYDGTKLPDKHVQGGDYPGGSTDGLYQFDNSRSTTLLGLKYRTLEESICDSVKSLQAHGV